MICSFECTFCKDCVELLHHICPNCGSGFEKRPIRPEEMLHKYPVSNKGIHKPVEIKAHYTKLKIK
ncbi:DUF1272 domain-containing protein [Winogradskyella sp. HB-48]|uniref:DUF1272 domain-containing protein n=1 Tax=Winogradskyella sp. HB-48 TaxID=3416808 RepID=UPI003CF59E45